MKAEEQYANDLWELLAKIKRASLSKPANHPPLRDETRLFDITISSEDELRLLRDLHFEAVIRIDDSDIPGFALPVRRSYPTSVPIEIKSVFNNYYEKAERTIQPRSLATQKLTYRSYDPKLGILYFQGQEISIVKQKNRIGDPSKEPGQAKAMRRLFKSVNTLNRGVYLREVTSVRSSNFDAQERKKVINYLSAINGEVNKVTGIKNLIIFDKVKYYIDKTYL